MRVCLQHAFSVTRFGRCAVAFGGVSLANRSFLSLGEVPVLSRFKRTVVTFAT